MTLAHIHLFSPPAIQYACVFTYTPISLRLRFTCNNKMLNQPRCYKCIGLLFDSSSHPLQLGCLRAKIFVAYGVNWADVLCRLAYKVDTISSLSSFNGGLLQQDGLDAWPCASNLQLSSIDDKQPMDNDNHREQPHQCDQPPLDLSSSINAKRSTRPASDIGTCVQPNVCEDSHTLAQAGVTHAQAGNVTGATIISILISTRYFPLRNFFHISKDGETPRKIFKNGWHLDISGRGSANPEKNGAEPGQQTLHRSQSPSSRLSLLRGTPMTLTLTPIHTMVVWTRPPLGFYPFPVWRPVHLALHPTREPLLSPAGSCLTYRQMFSDCLTQTPFGGCPRRPWANSYPRQTPHHCLTRKYNGGCLHRM